LYLGNFQFKSQLEHWLSWGFSWFSSVLPAKCWKSTMIMLQPLWNSFLPIVYESSHLQHYIVTILKSLSNNPLPRFLKHFNYISWSCKQYLLLHLQILLGHTRSTPRTITFVSNTFSVTPGWSAPECSPVSDMPNWRTQPSPIPIILCIHSSRKARD
jgi:hypothetical protein